MTFTRPKVMEVKGNPRLREHKTSGQLSVTLGWVLSINDVAGTNAETKWGLTCPIIS